MRITGSVAPDGKDAARIEYFFDVEIPTDSLPLRDLFAAFALQAVIGLNLEDASHRTDAIYAYAAADAMMAHRAEKES